MSPARFLCAMPVVNAAFNVQLDNCPYLDSNQGPQEGLMPLRARPLRHTDLCASFASLSYDDVLL